MNLARELNVHPATLGNWALGKNGPLSSEAHAAVKSELTHFLTGIRTPQPKPKSERISAPPAPGVDRRASPDPSVVGTGMLLLTILCGFVVVAVVANF